MKLFLDLKSTTEDVLRTNFERLFNYLKEENQMRGFKHFSIRFAKEETELNIPHGLPYKPLDLVQTAKQGDATITWNHDRFDATNINVTVADGVTALAENNPTIVRFYVGTHGAS